MLLVHAATFVHLTDLHLDLLFQEGTDPACHVKNQKLKNRNHYGRPKSQCDSPQALVEDTIYQIPTVDCIFFTGDSSRHDRDDIRPTTEQEVKTEISLVASIFQLRNLTVYPTIGNWDIFPQDNIPSGPNKQLQFLSEAWGPFIGHQESFLKGGYYSIYDNNLQMDIISMNTLYWFGYNEEINDCKGKHPGIQQFQWLDQQLSSSKGAILIGHVPPMSLTNRNYLPLCYEQYMDLIFKHQHKIRGQYFGHINSNLPFLLLNNRKRNKKRFYPLTEQTFASLSTEEDEIISFYFTGTSIVPVGKDAGYRIGHVNNTVSKHLEFTSNIKKANKQFRKERTLIEYEQTCDTSQFLSALEPQALTAFIDLLQKNHTIVNMYKDCLGPTDVDVQDELELSPALLIFSGVMISVIFVVSVGIIYLYSSDYMLIPS